jgi:hypothetical protein
VKPRLPSQKLVLGRRPRPAIDSRDFQFDQVMRRGPIPTTWDADGKRALADPVYGNDRWGNCVAVAATHFQRRAERDEHGRLPNVTTTEVVKWYRLLSELLYGGGDDGLVMADAFRVMRKTGIPCGGKLERIQAYLSVKCDPGLIRQAMCGKLGVQFGLALPITASEQWDAGRPWEVVSTKGKGAPGSWGGHAVYGVCYRPGIVNLVTWGHRQACTDDFLSVYAGPACQGEVWALVDVLDHYAALLDVPAIVAMLERA